MTRVVKKASYKLLFVYLSFSYNQSIISSPESDKLHDSVLSEEIAKARDAINKCQIRGMHGLQNPLICRIRTLFTDPELLGPLAEGENAILLYGPTGNGKTTLGQMIAEEIKEQFPNTEFIEIDCSTVKGPYENEGAKYLKVQFDKVKDLTEAGYKVVMLFDEIDSIVVEKEHDLQQKETAQCFWRFLHANRKNRNLLIIATTNTYDKLVTQVKSRFLNRIEVKSPEGEERISILQYYTAQIQFPLDLESISTISSKADGLGRRGLKNIILRLRQNKDLGIEYDLEKMIDEEKAAEEIKTTSFTDALWSAGAKIANSALHVSEIAAATYISNKISGTKKTPEAKIKPESQTNT